MRAVVQRVASASVEVDSTIVSSIGRGLVALVGVAPDDTPADVDWLARKLLATRLWPDPATGKPWALAPADVPPVAGAPADTKPGVDILLVSQFTLYASVRKGTKPDFSGAAPPDAARAIYASLLDRVREAYEPERVKDGVFGAMMKVSLVNDGPVTLVLDSRDAKIPRSQA